MGIYIKPRSAFWHLYIVVYINGNVSPAHPFKTLIQP